MNISSWWVAILDFCLPFASHSMNNSFVKFLDFENMGKVVRIEQLCCLSLDISISSLWSSILDCWYPLALHKMRNRSPEFLSLKIHVYSLRNFATMLHACWAISISSFKAAILDYRLPLALHSMGNRFLNSKTLETWELSLEFCRYVIYRLRYKYFRFVSRHFGFVTSACITLYGQYLHWIP